MCFSSWIRLTSEEESVSARHIKVLTTALLCAAGWWESKAKYWSVSVSLRYTSVLIVPSSSVVRSMSRKSSCPPDSLRWTECADQCWWGAHERDPPSHGGVQCMCHPRTSSKNGEGRGRWLEPCAQCPPLLGLPPPPTQETPWLCRGPVFLSNLRMSLYSIKTTIGHPLEEEMMWDTMRQK